ncbi:hypothetical protein DU002_03760 [Corallincola holothuriorum]|uniref:Uncharacterized protein n=1 Tax=Corallincola holothuriorum TaxID=2282215 RepID=A0A368NMG5_9GAMM|nr:hypothetical protein [Corallincola holothuriorum]RCU51598.1 hypothetical protein DU002_03760 [Corallincola holothuriorum]
MKSILISLLMLVVMGCSYQPQSGDWASYDDPSGWLPSDNGCKVNRYYVPDAVSVEWKGPCIDGFAIGKGALYWVEEDGVTGYKTQCLQPDHPRSDCFMGGVN